MKFTSTLTVGGRPLSLEDSVILDEAEIGVNTIIGANSTVKSNAKIPKNSLAFGSPAKFIRSLKEKEIAWKMRGTQEYIELTKRCLTSMYEIEPLSEDSADRLTYKEFQAEYDIKQNRAIGKKR